jgi:hypothetical protein
VRDLFSARIWELKIDFIIPWVFVTLDVVQSPPLSHISGSAAVDTGGLPLSK